MHIPTTALSALPLASLSSALPIAYPSEYTSPTLFIPLPRSHVDHSPPPTQSTVVHYTVRGDLPYSPFSLTTIINAQPAYKGNITVEKGVADARHAYIVWHASGYAACKHFGRRPGQTCECEYGHPMSKHNLERAQQPPRNLFLMVIEGAMVYYKMLDVDKGANKMAGDGKGKEKENWEKKDGREEGGKKGERGRERRGRRKGGGRG